MAAVDFRTIFVRYWFAARAMDKRDKFIAALRDEARARGLTFRAEKWRGKGGHMRFLSATD